MLDEETLIRLIEVYSLNWKTLDGLWFTSVESAFGLDSRRRARFAELERQAMAEASWLKEALGLREGGITSILRHQDTIREA